MDRVRSGGRVPCVVGAPRGHIRRRVRNPLRRASSSRRTRSTCPCGQARGGGRGPARNKDDGAGDSLRSETGGTRRLTPARPFHRGHRFGQHGRGVRTRDVWRARRHTHQGRRAADPVVRATMARIAQDETRHAALAWDIAHWAWTRLDDGARRRVECARARAICELRGDLAREPHAEVARVLGIPCSAVAMAMGEALEATVWRATA